VFQKHITTYNLSTVLKRLKQIIDAKTQNKYFWVKTQISKINKDQNGHYYLELIESLQGKLVAKANAIIWANQFASIQAELKNDSENILKNGSEILCYAAIEFSEIHGLRLQILEIDLSYSLGEIEKRKQANINYLQKQGLLNLNKQTKLAAVIQNVAVIGSPNSAGYADFVKHITETALPFTCHITLFPCAVQGDKALNEIIETLANMNPSLFDAIAIIRGGGSKFDLEIFNDLQLALTICKTKIPVLTGIGHETDQSIADIVAYQSLKTPTALADFILNRAHLYWLSVQHTYNQILEHYTLAVKQKKHEIQYITEQIKHQTQNFVFHKKENLHGHANKISFIAQEIVAEKRLELQAKTTKTAFLSSQILKNKKHSLKEIATYIEAHSKQIIQEKHNQITNNRQFIQHYASAKIKTEVQQLEKITLLLDAYNPQHILNLGYALLRKNGTLVSTNTLLKNGDCLAVELANKTITFTITNANEQIQWKDIPTKVPQQN